MISFLKRRARLIGVIIVVCTAIVLVGKYFMIFQWPTTVHQIKVIHLVTISPAPDQSTDSVALSSSAPDITLAALAGGFNDVTEKTQEILNKEFPGIMVVIEKPISFRNAAWQKIYDNTRGQFNANGILEELHKLPYANIKDENVIAVLPIGDLYTPDTNYVFSNTEGNVGVFAVSPLSPQTELNKTLLDERIQKVVMRMVGGMAGLQPRPFGDYSCVMRYSNSLQELDQKGVAWCGSEQEKILQAQGVQPSPSQ